MTAAAGLAARINESVNTGNSFGGLGGYPQSYPRFPVDFKIFLWTSLDAAQIKKPAKTRACGLLWTLLESKGAPRTGIE